MRSDTSSPLRQPLLNVGTAGHVDHGKTTLVESLTGIWASRHSEELKRGITLKIGYADAVVYKCTRCPPPQAYYTHATAPRDLRCRYCGSPLQPVRKISFVDVPGHEMLMSVMLSGAALMDGALLVIDATKKCPQPQTIEHFMALEIVGVRNLIVVQNKVDVVSKERAIENHREIKAFLEGTWAENAPIIPVSSLHRINVDALVWAIEKYIPTPQRDHTLDPKMLVLRSFDVNKPGTPAKSLIGGVLGGTIVQGVFRVGDEIEILPGARIKQDGQERYEPLYTEITSLMSGSEPLEVAYPGGLIAVGTNLDPSLTKADGLIGNIAGKPGRLPEPLHEVTLEYKLLERVVGVEKIGSVEPLKVGEPLMINIGTALTLGVVSSIRGDTVHLKLKIPVAAERGQRAAISRQYSGRWRLIGYGFVQ